MFIEHISRSFPVIPRHWIGAHIFLYQDYESFLRDGKFCREFNQGQFSRGDIAYQGASPVVNASTQSRGDRQEGREEGQEPPPCGPSEDFAGATPVQSLYLGTAMRHATSCGCIRVKSVEKIVHMSSSLPSRVVQTLLKLIILFII